MSMCQACLGLDPESFLHSIHPCIPDHSDAITQVTPRSEWTVLVSNVDDAIGDRPAYSMAIILYGWRSNEVDAQLARFVIHDA